MTTEIENKVEKDREALLHRVILRHLKRDMLCIMLAQLSAVFYVGLHKTDNTPYPLAALCLASVSLSFLITFGFYYLERKIKARKGERDGENTTCRSIKEGGKANDAVRVPKAAMFLLYLFLPKKDREEVLGDLNEEYPQMVANFGNRAAQLWFYKQVLTSLWPMLKTTGRTLVKWGLIGWLEEVFRRIAH